MGPHGYYHYGRPIKSTHFSLLTLFGDLFTPNSISPIKNVVVSSVSFLSGNFIFRKVSKV